MNLKELQPLVVNGWEFNEKNYPNFSKLTPDEQEKFVLRHIAQHISKNAGLFSELTEAMDHGKPLDRIKAKIALRKAVVNILRFSKAADIELRDVEDELRTIYKAK